MNPPIMETDEAMIAVSPICKSTPMNCRTNDNNNSDMDITSFTPTSPPGPNLFGNPPSIVRRPVLQHQHSYAGHEEDANRANNNSNNGDIITRAPSGRRFMGTRQQSMPELSHSRDDSFQGGISPSSSSFLNNMASQWTDQSSTQQQQRQLRNDRLFASPEGDDAPRQGSSMSSPVNNQQPAEETAEERARREEEESVALAQMLMAEEAVASHRMSADFLRMNSDAFSAEDFAALQNALQEEEDVEYDEEAEEDGEDVEEMSYEALLQLGERIGDVKTDRWTMIAHKEIEKLKTFQYDPETVLGNCACKEDIDDSEIKCLVCQFAYEKGDNLRRLPCGHCFHKDCVDQWLKTKDVCAYCRQSICPDKEEKK